MGHIDEIGLIVTHIDEQGYLWFAPVGGWDAQILVGQRVVLDTKAGPLTGVVGKKPIHLLRDEERKKVAELREMHIDIGARDGEEASGLVRVGDVAVIDAEPVELPNGRLTSRALDNRLGSYVALEAARIVAEARARSGRSWPSPPRRRRRPSAVRARAPSPLHRTRRSSSTSPTRPTLRGSTSRRTASTTSARVRSSAAAPSLNERLFELLAATAEAEKIPYTIEASGRATGTDADAVHLSRGGVPTGLVSIPLRYMHSPVELVQLDDVHACARLIAALPCARRRGLFTP